MTERERADAVLADYRQILERVRGLRQRFSAKRERLERQFRLPATSSQLQTRLGRYAVAKIRPELTRIREAMETANAAQRLLPRELVVGGPTIEQVEAIQEVAERCAQEAEVMTAEFVVLLEGIRGAGGGHA